MGDRADVPEAQAQEAPLPLLWLQTAQSQLETWDSPAAGCAAGHGGRQVASRAHMHSHDE